MYLTDIIQLPAKNLPLDLCSLHLDYVEKGLSLRQISVEKVHSRQAISETLKAAGVQIRASGQAHGNPSQLKYGYRKEVGKVIIHKGEKLIVEAIKDFRAEGMTLRQIAHRMTALKIPSKQGKTKWHPMMVKRALGD